MGVRGLPKMGPPRPRRPRASTAAPTVPYPPSGWTPARLLGARRPPRTVALRSAESSRRPLVHAQISSDQFVDVLWAAARAAAAAPSGNVERHLWARLDPGMADRSAAAKLEVKSMYVHDALRACFGDLFSSTLRGVLDGVHAWLAHAEAMAGAMETMFQLAMRSGRVLGWSTREWWPFETYDRTVSEHAPSMAGCFTSDEQRLRSRKLSRESRGSRGCWWHRAVGSCVRRWL